MQKKRIASGAAHRKRGAKSKKCTLPHDNLTKKELRALSGEVKTYNIHQRLAWAQFKELPDDLAAEHIAYLVDTFGANIGAIAAALGVCYDSVFKYLKSKGIKLKKRVFIETPEWLAFIGEPVEPAPVPVEPAPAETEPETVAAPSPVPSMVFARGNLVLKGPKGQVLQRLFEVLPDNVTVDVHFLAEGAEGAVAGAERPYWFTV
jgi:hypothetical protein